MTKDVRERLREALRQRGAPLAIGLAAVVAHLRALWNGYAFDDVAIVAHPLIQSVATLPKALAAPWWYDANRLYRPVALLSLGVDRLLGGGAPWLPHAVNIAMHGVASALVAVLCLRFLPRFAALSAALVFAVLPVHAEAVASVVGRAELVSALAMLLLLLRVTRDDPDDAAPSWRSHLMVSILSALALGGKETGATAPALVFAAAWAWPSQRRHAPRWAASALAGTVVLLAARVGVLGSLAGDVPHPFFRGMEATTRITVALAQLPRMAAMLFLPVEPAVEDVPTLAAALSPNGVAIAAGVALVFAALVLMARHARTPSALTLGSCIAAVALLPTANLLFAAGAVTGRTLYSPSIGAALISGAAIAALGASRLAPVARYLVATVAASAAVVTVREATVWRDTPTVVATMIERHPENFRAHELLAYAARDAGRPDAALDHFREAIDRFPASPELLTDAATVALRLHDTVSATHWLRTAVHASPRAARARTRLYTVLRARGDTARAKALLLDGLRLDPEQHTWKRLLEIERPSSVR